MSHRCYKEVCGRQQGGKSWALEALLGASMTPEEYRQLHAEVFTNDPDGIPFRRWPGIQRHLAGHFAQRMLDAVEHLPYGENVYRPVSYGSYLMDPNWVWDSCDWGSLSPRNDLLTAEFKHAYLGEWSND